MKRFLTLLVGLVATSVCYSAPTYTSYFNNTHTYTNATVVGTNFAGSGVFTNNITTVGGTFVGHPSSSASFWGSSDFTGLSSIDVASSAEAFQLERYFGVFDSGTPNTYAYQDWFVTSDNAGYGILRKVTGTTTGRLALTVDSDGPRLTFGGSSTDVYLLRDAADTLAMRNGTTGQELRVYGTYTDASNYEYLSLDRTGSLFTIATVGAGTGSQKALRLNGSTLNFFTGGTERWNFSTTGHFLATTDNAYDIGASGATRPRAIYVAGVGVFGNSVTVGAGNNFYWNGRSGIASPANSIITIANGAGTDFDRLQFGGTTASFPALKRSTTELQVRLADDSADADLSAEDITVSGNVGATLSVGDTTFINLSKASQTNSVTGALTFAHATNGVHGIEKTHARWFFTPSGGPHTLTIPATWRTNVYSAVPPALTNGTVTVMYCKSGGPTADAASQTNVYVSFEYYK